MNTEVKKETATLNAARIYKNDYDFIQTIFAKHPNKADAFAELVAKCNNGETPNTLTPEQLAQLNNDAIFAQIKYESLSPEQQNEFLSKIFSEDFYKTFSPADHPHQALVGIIEAVNFAKAQKETPTTQTSTPGASNVTDFVPDELKEKVARLKTHLIGLGQAPADTSDQNYLEQLLTEGLKFFFENKFKNV